jgi:hypothetical protein
MSPRTKPGGGGRGAGHRGRSSQNNSGSMKTNTTSSDKTKQSLDDLTDVIFDVGDNRTADGFISAKKRLVEYVGSTFDLGADIAISIKTGTLHIILMPVEPVTAVIMAAVPEVLATPGTPVVLYRAARNAVIPDPTNNIVGVAARPVRLAQVEVPPTPYVPSQPVVHAPLSNMQQMILSGQVKSYLYQVNKLAENIKKAYAIILKHLQSKLEECQEWAALTVSCDVLEILELIRSLVFKYEECMYQPLSLHRVKQAFYSFHKGKLSNVDYLQAFKN